MLLNSQFTSVLNGIICFSVRFCDSSLLVFKKCIFRSCLSQAKRYKGDREILMLLLVLYKTLSQFFEILILTKIFGETFIMPLKSTSFPKELR